MTRIPVPARLLPALLAACTPGTDLDPTPPYRATIRWTDHGIPHVVAEDFGSVAYGYGWAFQRDHACVLLEQLLKVRGERARWFGPGESGQILDEDVGWRALDPVGQATASWDTLPERQQAVLAGYAAGFSAALAEHGTPAPCADAGWVRPITGHDVLTYALGLGYDGSGAIFVQDIGRATPPGGSVSPPPPRGLDRLHELGRVIRNPRLGSNGWAIGADRSTNGRGLLLGNPHFPSVGEKQWYEVHLTVPGELDVYGASLLGVPIVNVGFNAHVAWTHTVSYAPRFVAYGLELDPADPTRYRFGDGWRDMTSRTHELEVLGEDGRVDRVTRTTWASHYGPVIDAPVLGWSATTAISLRDVNAANLEMFSVWEGMNLARSLDELRAAHDVQGIPWVYTIAADAEGQAWFADTSRTPNLSPAAIDGWYALRDSGTLLGFFAEQLAGFGAILLDGSDPANTWVEDPRAAIPGLVPLEDAPQRLTGDYVFNANDSAWLTNVAEPIEDYEPALYGPIRTARSARTRMNARLLAETGPGSASGDDGTFTRAEVEAAALGMRSSLVEVALPGVLERCDGLGSVDLSDDESVDVTDACAALAAWDGTYRIDQEGAVVWRALLAAGVFDVGDLNAGGGGLLATPFDPDDPLGTPRDLVPAPETGADPVLRALALAARRLDELGHAGDPLGALQRMPFEDGTFVGLPGGQYWEGTIGIAEWGPDATTSLLPRPTPPEAVETTSGHHADGWWINDGNSFVLVVGWEDDGPRGRAVITYGQSDDPASPYLHDQATLYAPGTLRDVAFTEAQIEAATIDELVLDVPGTP